MPITLTDKPIALLFRAVADPTRLRILALLIGDELCVCDLVAVLGVPQPTASRHLAYLRKAGLVAARRDGQWIYYRLARSRTAVQKKLLECVQVCFRYVPELEADSKRLPRVKALNQCCE